MCNAPDNMYACKSYICNDTLQHPQLRHLNTPLPTLFNISNLSALSIILTREFNQPYKNLEAVPSSEQSISKNSDMIITFQIPRTEEICTPRDSWSCCQHLGYMTDEMQKMWREVAVAQFLSYSWRDWV